MSENNKSKSEFTRTKFHTIRVNDYIYNYLLKLEKKTGLSKQQILLNSISMYRAFLASKTRFQLTHDKLDKAIWYIIKLNYAVFEFRNNPKDKFQNVMEIIQQVENRLSIDLSLLKKTVMNYLNAKEITNELKIEITNALKLALIDILESVFAQ
jgi:hypothetical protein